MKDVIADVGIQHFLDRFRGCMFFDEQGQPCYVDGQDNRSTVRSWVVKGTGLKASTSKQNLPLNYFKDLVMFKVPPLGWRMAEQGKYLVHYRRNNRAYHKGVSAQILDTWMAPSTQLLIHTGDLEQAWLGPSSATVVALVMKPEFIPLRDGIKAMKNGDLFSFCSSANIAVIPEVDEQQAVYYNRNKIGVVTKDGKFNCKIPLLSSIIKEQL